MPIYINKVWKELGSKKDKFRDMRLAMDTISRIIDIQFPEIIKMGKEQIKNILSVEKNPGAIPIEDYGDSFSIDFNWNITTHEKAFKWAEKILEGKRVTAIDGSQIYPLKEIGLALSLVQIAYFTNTHDRKTTNPRDAEVFLITPDEFKQSSSDVQLSRTYVDVKRFCNECFLTSKLMKKYPGSLFFFDGTIVPTFTKLHGSVLSAEEITALNHLLTVSEETKSPLIGYIDNSYAHDLFRMMSILISNLDEKYQVSDASMVSSKLKNFGDRTPIHICKRENFNWKQEICFTYVRTDSMRPSRLEFPYWMVERNTFDEVFKMVIAETIIGGGYPYPLDSAHDEAILKMKDKDVFITLIQKFAKENNLKLPISMKVLKKRKRR